MHYRAILNREWLSGMRWVWSLGGLTPSELTRRVWKETQDDELPDRAAQLSFYLLLALFPTLIFVSALMGFVFAGDSHVYDRLLSRASAVMPWSAYQLVRATMQELVSDTSGAKISFGLIAALWTASSGMQAIINGLNAAYDIQERRPWWKRRVIAILLTIVLSLMTLVAFVVVVAGSRVRRFLVATFGFGDAFHVSWTVAQVLIPVAFMFVVFILLLRYAPNTKSQSWQALVPGAFVTEVCWLAATGLFKLYLHFFNSYSRTYGSMGAVIVLLLWLYVTGFAVLLGGEVNAEIRKAAAEAGAPAARLPLEAPGSADAE